jgi:hypothetical protein
MTEAEARAQLQVAQDQLDQVLADLAAEAKAKAEAEAKAKADYEAARLKALDGIKVDQLTQDQVTRMGDKLRHQDERAHVWAMQQLEPSRPGKLHSPVPVAQVLSDGTILTGPARSVARYIATYVKPAAHQ